MREALPFPGSTRAKLIDAGLQLFSARGYDAVEVDVVAAQAGVTVGALYHHFRSKQGFYCVLRDEMSMRLLDRMEAAADAAPPERRLAAVVLAAYDGWVRIKAGKLLAEPDPRGTPDAIANYLATVAEQTGRAEAAQLGPIIAAALRAAMTGGGAEAEGQAQARRALQSLLE